jgi:hypothetical protein
MSESAITLPTRPQRHWRKASVTDPSSMHIVLDLAFDWSKERASGHQRNSLSKRLAKESMSNRKDGEHELGFSALC